MTELEQLPTTLIDVLANSVVLRQLCPYIPISGLLGLSATCRSIRQLINTSPDPWRHMDLTGVRSALIDSSPIDVGGVSWRAERMDESLTEDEFYAGPLRGIFGRLHRRDVLAHVQTLILDGLSVPADLVREILAEERYSIRMLSLREATHLNQTKLQSGLRYLVRPTRAEGTPKLKALYVFGPKNAPRSVVHARQLQPSTALGVTASEGAQIGAEWNQKSSAALISSLHDDEARWYGCSGRAMKRPLSEWPATLQACRGLIAFDAVLCRGPRHDITQVESSEFLQPAVATVALGPSGCESCGTCPEGAVTFAASHEAELPLLSPPPRHSSTVRAAQCPQIDRPSPPRLILRCEECLRGRWCERCNRWWCETCYKDMVSRVHLHTEMQQVEQREELKNRGWSGSGAGPPVKVYSKLCVEHCLVSEMMSGAGSNGMWG